MIFKNVAWQLAEKIIRLSATIVVSALVARYLGPEGFGKFNYINAIIAIILVVTSLGLNRILVRESTHCVSEIDHNILVSTAFFLRLISSVLFFLIISFFMIFFNADEDIFYIIPLASIIFVSFDVIDYHLQGQSIFKVATTCRVIGFAFASLLRVYFVFTESKISYFYLTILVEYAITGVLIYITSQNKYKNKTNISLRLFSSKKAKTLLNESWPEIIAGFGAITFMKMDQIMLQYLQGDTSVGIYSAATRISESWYFIPTAFVAAIFPVLMKKYNENESDNRKDEVMENISCVMSILVWLSIFAAIFTNLFGGNIIDLVYGSQYSESATILKLHIWAGVFLCMGITSGSWLVAEKRLKLNLYRNLSGLALNFILNIFLIPIYGTVGAAVATILGLAMAFFVFDLFHKELRKMFFLKIQSFSPFRLVKSIQYLLKIK